MDIQACAFDIDGTLTESKSRLTHDVADRICQLLDKYPIALITGGTYGQIREKIIEVLVTLRVNLKNLHMLPLSGAEYYDQKGRVSQQTIPILERKKIAQIIERTAKELGLWIEHTWGDAIEDRLCQVTFSAWGQEAPLEIKREWDVDGRKKQSLRDALQPQLAGYSIRVGGTTSIDVSPSNVDKGRGILTFAKAIDINPRKIMFIGDQLQYGGNDYPVLATGAYCIPVRSVEETVRVIDAILLEKGN